MPLNPVLLILSSRCFFLSLFMNTSNTAYDYMGDKCTSFYRYFQYIFPTY